LLGAEPGKNNMSKINTKEPSAKVSRKLSLNREMVRSLSTESLQEVAGGCPASIHVYRQLSCLPEDFLIG
jgi:hypothetical protein